MFNPFRKADPTLTKRRRMIEEQIRGRGVRDEAVLTAMMEIPREEFLPAHLQLEAYEDRAIGIGLGQTISQPYIVGYMTEQLSVSSRHTVLEIGTGTGYQTAILARIARQVYSVERIAELHERAARALARLGIHNVSLLVGDGSFGWPEHAPYDRIIVTAGAPHVPQPLVDQLAEGGLMVVPVGGESEQTLVRVSRIGGRVAEQALLGCRFVKLIGEEGWQVERGPDPSVINSD